MESNRDEAYKCIAIAQKSLAAGDFNKASKFAEKSIRLFPTGQGEQLLKTIQVKSKARPTGSAQVPKTEPDRKYTVEQTRAVKAILACGQDYYKVLSVEKSASDVQIKKAYRKLALQFHPDKNSAPGADEAFKLISKAFDTLSDNQKRAIHDSGGDRIRYGGGGGGGGASNYQRQHYRQQQQQDDFLNMFFGNNNNMRHSYERRQRNPQTSETENMTPLIPIVLIALLFIFSLLFTFEGEPAFNFRPTQLHTNQRFTKLNNVKYYVQPQFDTTVRANQFKFQSIERQIESDWLSELRFQCQREQRRKSEMFTRAEGFLWGTGRDHKLYKQAEEMKMPNCDEAKKLMTRIR